MYLQLPTENHPSGLTKQWDLSNYDNLKYPATRYFDPDNGKGVTHLETNDKYLVTGHGNIVLIWSLDTAAILSEAVGLDSQFDFIGSLGEKLVLFYRSYVWSMYCIKI